MVCETTDAIVLIPSPFTFGGDRTGVFGPCRAEDIPAFLAAGGYCTQPMRTVRFDLLDRVVLIPVELVHAIRYFGPVALALGLLLGWCCFAAMPTTAHPEGSGFRLHHTFVLRVLMRTDHLCCSDCAHRQGAPASSEC